MLDRLEPRNLLAAVSVATSHADEQPQANGSPDSGQFIITRDAVSSDPLTVYFEVSGTADYYNDYQRTPDEGYYDSGAGVWRGYVTIPANAASATVDIMPVHDAQREGNETLTIALVEDSGCGCGSSGYTLGTPSAGTMTIADNDDWQIGIVASDPSELDADPNHAGEGSANDGYFTISRSGETDVSFDLPVQFLIQGNARHAYDYTLWVGPSYNTSVSTWQDVAGYWRGQATIPAGSQAISLRLDATTDDYLEFEEEATLELVEGDGCGCGTASYTLGQPSQATVTIADDELGGIPTVIVVAVDDEAYEPATSGGQADLGKFHVRRTGDASVSFVIDYLLSGSAQQGTDYGSLPGNIEIPAGASGAHIQLTPRYDGLGNEGDELATLTLQASSGCCGSATFAIEAPSKATVTISDNQAPEIEVRDAAGVLIHDNTSSFHLGGTSVGAPLAYTFTANNVGGVDLTLDPASLTLPAGFTLFSPFAESVPAGGSTTFTVQFNAETEAYYSGALSFGTSDDDENPFNFTISAEAVVLRPEASVRDSAYNVIADNTGAYDFGETPFGSPVTRTFTIYNEGASDLTLDPDSISVPAGFSVVAPFDEIVPVNGSTTLVLRLDATLSGSRSGEISFATNDADENPYNFAVLGEVGDPPPGVSIADATGHEGFGLAFTVALSSPRSHAITVHYATSSGSADAADFADQSGTVTFAPQETTRTILIETHSDTQVESNETFTITLSEPSGAVLGDAEATGTIVENLAPTVASAAGDITVAEDAGDTTLDLAAVFHDVNVVGGDVLTYSIVNTTPGLLTASVAGSTLTLDYLADQHGAATMTVRATDAAGLFVEDQFAVAVVSVEDPPAIAAALADRSVAEDAADTVIDLAQVFADGDIAIDGDVLSYAVVSNTNGALVVASVVGSSLILDYQPEQHGSAQITIRATDATGRFVEDSLQVTVDGVNDAPAVAATNSDGSVNEDAANTTMDLSAVFVDADLATAGDLLTLSAVVSNPGLIAVSLSGAVLTLDYGANQHGTATITVRATDLAGAFVEDVFTITVAAINDTPEVVNPIVDFAVAYESADSVFDLASVFGDADIATNGDSLTFTVTANTNSQVVAASITDDELRLVYQPGQFGTATITLRAEDQTQAQVETSFQVTVHRPNVPPSIVSPVADVAVAEDSADVAIEANGVFADPDMATYGDVVTYSLAGNSNPAMVAATLQNGLLVLDFLPHRNGVATITLRATDEFGAWEEDTFQVSAASVNDAPFLASGVVDDTVDEDAPNTVFNLATVFGDVDAATNGDVLTYSVVNGNPALVAAAMDGSILTLDYVANQNGVANFTVRATDSAGAWLEDTFQVTASAVHDAPYVQAPIGDGSVNEDAASTVLDLANVFADADIATNGDSLQIQVQDNDNPAVVTAQVSGGQLTLSYAADQHGEANITLRAMDLSGSIVDLPFRVTVNAVNDAPEVMASLGGFCVLEDGSDALIDLSGVFTDADIATASDQLALTVSNSNPSLLTASISGSQLTLHYLLDQHGEATLRVRATDSHGVFAESEFTITSAALNDVPTIVQPVPDQAVDEDAPSAEFDLSTVFHDPDIATNADALAFTVINDNPTLLSATIVGETLALDYVADQHGVSHLTLRAADILGSLVEQSFTVTVASVNDPPVVAAPTSAAVISNTATSLAGVSVSDVDAGDAAVAVSISVQAGMLSLGSTAGLTFSQGDGDQDASIAAEGSIADLNAAMAGLVYRSNNGFEGADSVVITIDDQGHSGGDPQTGSAAIQLSVRIPVAPVAVANGYRVGHDRALVVDAATGVLANDADWEHDPLIAELLADVEHGSLTLNENGSFTYTPNAGFVGEDHFTYRPVDAWLAGNSVAVTIVVDNTAPRVAPDTYRLQANHSLTVPAQTGVAANDHDPEEDALTISLIDGPAHGGLSLDANGGFIYTPDTGFVGVDSFTYRASDGLVASPAATVTITAGNAAPHAVADWLRTRHGQPLTLAAPGVLENDWDQDSNTLTAAVVQVPQHGVLTLVPDGSLTYTPEADFVGEDSFTYQASDGLGQSGVVAVTITVSNAAPAINADAYRVSYGQTLSVDADAGLLANDLDVDDDNLTAVLGNDVSHGDLSLAADGSFTYTPAADFVGTDSFTYQISDGVITSAAATVTIQVANTKPVAHSDSFTAHTHTTLSVGAGAVFRNDYDPEGNPLSAVLVDGTPSGVLNFNVDGTFSYTSAPGFVGQDSFTYRVSDGVAESDVATVTIDVANATPWVTGRRYATQHDAALTASAPGLLEFAGDADGDLLSLTVIDNVNHGTLAVQPDGSFTYTPGAGFAGTDAFRYVVDDGASDSPPALVTLEVTNSAPVAVRNYYSVSHDRVLSVNEGVLQNDSDADSDALTASIVQNVANGVLSFTSGGAFVYTPAVGFIGSDSFTYRASDGVAQAEATVHLEVVNLLPASTDDRYGVLAGQTLARSAATGVLANDIDVDSDTMTVSLVDDVEHGSLTLSGNGSFTYTPAAGFTGRDRFTYRASDGTPSGDNGQGNTAVVTIAVYDQTLVAVDDAWRVNHDSTLTGNVNQNDFNGNGAALSVSLIAAPQHGALSLSTDGAFSYVPASQFLGTDTFTYELTGGGQTSVASATIEVVNSTPALTGSAYRVSHDRLLQVAGPGLLEQATDTEGDTLTIALVSAPSHGELVWNADGSFTYTPAEGFSGEDQFTYSVSDGLASSQPVAVVLEVMNAAPLSFADHYEVLHDETLSATATGVLVNDLDWDQDDLTAVVTEDVAHGTLVLHADGTFVYTPAADYVGEDSFTYRANDGLTNGPVTTVTLHVVNGAPAGYREEYEVLHDRSLVVAMDAGVLKNDRDCDGDAITAVLEADVQHGSLALAADGSFTYTPAAGFTGSDSFTYRVSDGVTTIAPVEVEITVRNEAPVGQADSYIIGRNKTLTVAGAGVLANDADLDNDALTIALESNVSHGTLTLAAGGGFSYVPAAGFVGKDTFAYSLNDGVADSETVTVEIEVVNTAPRALGNTFTTPHDVALTVAAPGVLGNDYDLDGDSLAATLSQDVSYGDLTLNADGSFSYTPAAGFEGVDTFRYHVGDAEDQTDPVVVTINVHNTRPEIVDQRQRVVHDRTLNVAVDSGLLNVARDAEDDDLTIELVADVRHGSLTIQADGAYTYTPAAGFTGIDSFTYRVSDGLMSSAAATVLLEVANTAPSAVADAYTVAKNTTLTVDTAGVLQNDWDFDAETLIASLVTSPAQGTITFNANGTFVYAPAASFAGYDSFTYKVTDGIDESYGTVLVEVTGSPSTTSQVPGAGNDYYQVNHGKTLDVGFAAGLLSNDFDPNGDWLRALLILQPSQGVVTLEEDGAFRYAPPSSTFTGTVTFTYKVTDEVQESAPATVTIKVLNAAPSAANAAFQTHQGQSLAVPSGFLQRFATDRDGDNLSFELVADVSHGSLSLNADGSFNYAPAAGYVGHDTFTYRVSDGVTTSSIASVTLDVTNTRPFATAREFRAPHGETFTSERSLLATAGDADGDDLTAELVTPACQGSVTVTYDGSFTYTPAAGFAGTDTFTYRVHDGAEWSQPMTVTLDVANTAPNAFDSLLSVHHDTQLKRLIDFWDSDGDTLTPRITQGASHGTLTLDSSGLFTYTPSAGYAGPDSFKFKVNDSVEDSAEATVTIDVTNAKPIAGDGSYTARLASEYGNSVHIDLKGNIWDADGDSLTIHNSLGAGGTFTLNHGSLAVNLDGTLTFTPSGQLVGTDTFTYTAFDGAEHSEAATVTIRVVNGEPFSHDQTFRFHAVDVPSSSTNTYFFDLGGLGSFVADPDGDEITFGLVDSASSGAVTLNPNGTGSLQIGDTFTGTVTFTYQATDGVSESDPATVKLVIENEAPFASNDYFSMRSGGTLEIYPALLLDNDFDVRGDQLQLVASSVSTPSAGALTLDGGAYKFEPGNFAGTATFTYKVTDGLSESDPATVSIEVINTAPWGINASKQLRIFSGDANGALSSASDFQFRWDLENDHPEIVNLTGPGEFSGDGTFELDSAAPGEYLLEYQVSDGQLTSDPYRLTVDIVDPLHFKVDDEEEKYGSFEYGFPALQGQGEDYYKYNRPTITPLNTAPAAANDGPFLGLHGKPISGNTLLFNDYDPDGDTLTVSLVGGPTYGSVVLDPSGAFTYTPTAKVGPYDYVGVDSYSYMINDGHGHTATASVAIELTNQEPIAHDADPTWVKGSVPYPVYAHGSDPDGDALTYRVDSVSVGSYIINGAGYGFFTPPGGDPNWVGTVTVQFTVIDSAGASASGTVTMHIVSEPLQPVYPPPPVPPVANEDKASWIGNTLYGSVLSNDWSAYGGLTVVNAGTYTLGLGVLDLDSDGSFTYTVAAGFEDAFVDGGPVTFGYTITDYGGLTDSAILEIGPLILKPGEIASSPSGDAWVWNAPEFTNGFGHIIPWFAGDDAHVKNAKGDNFYFEVHGNFYSRVVGNSLIARVSGDVLTSVTSININLSVTGDVAADPAVDAIAGAGVRVDVQGDIDIPVTGGRIFSVYAGGNIHSVSGVTIYYAFAGQNLGPVSASSSIGTVGAVFDVMDVVSAGEIDSVHAHRHLVGSVTAGGAIGFRILSPRTELWYSIGGDDYDALGGIFAGYEIQGSIDSPGAMAMVRAGSDIKNTVSAGKGLYLILSQEGSILDAVTAKHIGRVDAKLDVGQTVTATTSLGRLRAGRDVIQTISAGNHIGALLAGRHVLGELTAGGNLGFLAAGNDGNGNSAPGDFASPAITIGGSIGRIDASRSILATTLDSGGFIGPITAGSNIDSEITAAASIGAVTAPQGIAGSIISGKFIDSVKANQGDISASLTAATDIGPVYAYNSITGSINSQTVLYLKAEHGDANVITAAKGTGNVFVGANITGNISSSGGSLGKIRAGHTTTGDIQGTVESHGNIYHVAATIPDDPASSSVFVATAPTNYTQAMAAFMGNPNASLADLPKPPAPPAPRPPIGGNILKLVKASGSIGAVLAGGHLMEGAEAGKSLRVIAAQGDIRGAIKSGEAFLIARAGGEFKGNIDAKGTVVTSSYGLYKGSVTSHEGAVSLQTWKILNGESGPAEVKGKAGVSVYAHEQVNAGPIESSDGVVMVSSTGSVDASVKAKQIAAVNTQSTFQGKITSLQSTVYAVAVQRMIGTVEAKAEAILSSLESIKGSIKADEAVVMAHGEFDASLETKQSISLNILGAVRGTVHSTEGDVYVEAGNIEADVVADQGRVGLNVYGDLTGEVKGAKQASVVIRGQVTKDIASQDGSVVVLTDGDITGNLHAKMLLDVVSWGNVTGDMTADLLGADIIAYGGIQGQVNAGGSVDLFTWGDVGKKIEADHDVSIFTRGDIQQDVTAGGSVAISAGGAVLGDVTAGTYLGPNSVVLVATGNVSGDVTASGGVFLNSLGNVHSDVTAHDADVDLTALGDFQGDVTATGDVTVFVGGTVDNSEFEAGLSVSLAAHDKITNTDVRALFHAAVLSTKNIENSSVTAQGEVSVGSLKSIAALTITAGNDASISAGESADLTANSYDGDVTVLSLGGIKGSYFAGRDLVLNTYGKIENVTAGTGLGSAFLFGETGVDANVVAAQDIAADSLDAIQGTYHAGGEITLTALADVDATANAQKDLIITAGGSLKGTATSEHHSATAVSTGIYQAPPDPDEDPPSAPKPAGVEAEITAFRHAAVTAIMGDIAGQVEAKQGDATVSAGGKVRQAVTAGRDAIVSAMDSVLPEEDGSGGVTAGGDALVSTLEMVNVNVTSSGGQAVVYAGKDIDGEVTAYQSAIATSRTGGIQKPVTSQTADVVAIAMGDVRGDITAGTDAVVASLSNVLGATTAQEDAIVSAAGGRVQGAVNAGVSAVVLAYDNITGAIAAGTDALASTMQSQVSPVSAGRDAVVLSADAVSGAVQAGRHALVVAFGAVSGDIEATNGSVIASSAAGFNNAIAAGDFAFVLAGDGLSQLTVDADDLFLVSFGTTIGTFDATNNAFVWSAGMLSGTLNAGGDALAISLASSNLGVTAGNSAAMMVFDDYVGSVHAGQDAFVFGMGGVSAGVTAGRDAGVYGMDYVVGSIDAARYAGLVSWGPAVGPMNLSGYAGASAWVYDDFLGEIESANGSALAAVYGDAVGAITAGKYVMAMVVGDILGGVTAGESALLLLLSNFDGRVIAGEDAFLFGQGDLNLQLDAGRDVYVSTVGDIRGRYTAGRDGHAISYADFDATLTTGRDVEWVWTRGDIRGVIAAERNIGPWHEYEYHYSPDYTIFAHGEIDAAIYALNAQGVLDGGHIAAVQAIGPIAGEIRAAESISHVRSGGAVTALISAPVAPAPIENDASLALEFPLPDLPASITPDVLAAVAAARADVLAARSESHDAATDLLAAFAADKADAANALAVARNSHDAALADAKNALVAALQQLKADALQDRDEALQQAATAAAEHRAEAAEDRAKLVDSLDQRRQELDKKKAAAQNAVAEATAVLAALDTAMAQLRATVLDASAEQEQSREATWQDAYQEALQQIAEENLAHNVVTFAGIEQQMLEFNWTGALADSLTLSQTAATQLAGWVASLPKKAKDYYWAVVEDWANSYAAVTQIDRAISLTRQQRELVTRSLSDLDSHYHVDDYGKTYRLPPEAKIIIERLAEFSIEWLASGASFAGLSDEALRAQRQIAKMEARVAADGLESLSQKSTRRLLGTISDDGKYYTGSLGKLLNDFRTVAPKVKIRRISKKSYFDVDTNTIMLQKGQIRVGVLADEMQHALDYANGFGKDQMNDVLYHATVNEGFAVLTDEGLTLANEWWHRRILTRAIQNIDQGTPGFRMLADGIKDVHDIYLDKAKGTLSLEQLKKLIYTGWY